MPIDTPDWVRDAAFYQIFPDRFAISPRLPKPGPLEAWDTPPTTYGFKGGDLLGVAERLPYLEDLGINAIYLTPIFSSASNHRYHTYDYFQVDPLLGGSAALRELLDEAHARGIRVVLDGVFNHTGRGFWAFHHVLETGAASPYRHWFHFDQAGLDAGRPIRAYPKGYEGRAGVDMDEPGLDTTVSHRGAGALSLERLGYMAWWDMPALPKLNTDDPHAREHLLSAAEHWLRFGIDGWRLDVPEEVPASFWEEFRRRCRAVRPDAYIVGEIWHEAPEWLAGDRFDAVMNYPLGKAILGFTAAPSFRADVAAFHYEYSQVRPVDGPAFAREVERLMGLYDPDVTAVQLNLVDSHDTPRFLTLADGDRAALRLAVLLQATLPGAPCVYYGDEIGLEGGRDPDCRRAFPADEGRWDHEVHAWFRAVLHARRAHEALRRGELRVLAAAAGAIAFSRSVDRSTVVVAVNAGPEPVELDLALALAMPVEARFVDVSLPGSPDTDGLSVRGGRGRLRIGGRSGRILVEA